MSVLRLHCLKMTSTEEQLLKTKEQFVEKPKKKTLRERIAYIKDNITVEPVLTCYVIPGALARLATQNLNLDKACRVNLNYGETVCSALIAREGSMYLKEELAVQELIAAMESWKNVLLTAIPSLLILFLGAWSDRTGKRKICILLPIIGDLLMCLSNILNAYFFYELPVEVTMFFEAFFPAITGGWITTYMGAFSYISDVSSEESRTFRVGIANLCLTAGSPIGSVLSGVLLKHIGYYGVFSVCSLLYIFSIIYGFYYIKDPKRPENIEKNSSGVCGFLKSFFDGKHVKDTLQVAFKKGPNRRRTKSILILATIAFIYGPAYGEFTVRYLFTRYRFNWDALMYSFYGTFYVCIHCLGAIISISLFSHRLKWDDSVLGMISMCSKVTGALATAFARNTTEMYIDTTMLNFRFHIFGVLFPMCFYFNEQVINVHISHYESVEQNNVTLGLIGRKINVTDQHSVAVETFNATSFTALRSISSKLCTSDELGKMISVFNLMEVLTSMVFGPVYSWIYMYTLKRDAGIMYYVSTVMTIPAFSIFGWFFIQHKKSLKHELKQKDICNQEKCELQTKNHKDDLLSSIDLADEKIL